MSSQFLAPNFDGGLHAPHYFNGRLLSAEELQADQLAVLTRQGWLGLACGYGVIDGLTVTQIDVSQAKIAAGMGINRQGQVIRVPADITVALAPQASPPEPVNDTGRFTICTPANNSPDPATQEGAFLLTALPASHFEGRAPARAIPGGSVARANGNTVGCGSQWEVEGVQFKIIRLLSFDAHSADITADNLCNQLAHWCYGSSAQPELALDPFHFPALPTGFALLDPADLTPCDLPLAVFYWTGSAISFIDIWSARRRLVRSDALVDSIVPAIPIIPTPVVPIPTPAVPAHPVPSPAVPAPPDTPGRVAPAPEAPSPPLSGSVISSPAPAVPASAISSTGSSALVTPVTSTSLPVQTIPPSNIQHTLPWKGLISDERLALVQARFLQFQDQIQQLIDPGQASEAVMKNYFRFLPPAGFLPVTLSSLSAFIDTLDQGGATAPQLTNPFIEELKTLLQSRLQAEGAAGNAVNRGENNFDYGMFFESRQYFLLHSRLTDTLVMRAQVASGQADIPVVTATRTDPPSDDQLWYFQDGYIISKLTGNVLTGSHPSNLTEPGSLTPFLLHLTASAKNSPKTQDQQWTLDKDGYLVCQSNNYVADVFRSLTAEGTTILSYYSRNNPPTPNQHWYREFVPGISAGAPFAINKALVDGAHLASVLQQAWYDDVIDVAQLYMAQQTQFPALNTYFVRENLLNPSSPPYVLFARATRPPVWSLLSQ